MSFIGAGAIYLVLYRLFDKFVWRKPLLSRVLRVPNLEGKWECDGISFVDEDGVRVERPWSGTVTISQSWDRLRIRLATAQSSSHSVVGAIRADEDGDFRLFYNYANDPKGDQLKELKAHAGFCDMRISADQKSAEGEYFNARGRVTFGSMQWRRNL